MHRTLVLLLLLALVPPAVGQDPATTVISELHPDPDGGREFVELHNPTATAIDLAGWRIEDAAGNGFTFERTLAPGAYLVLWSGGDADALGPAMPGSSVWNNGGDTATLFDAGGAVVDSVAYGSGAVPAPAKGQSLHRAPEGWVEAEPSPGAARGQQAATGTVTVENVPPRVTFLSIPDRLRPGEAGIVSIEVHEPNGEAATWTLHHGPEVLHQGAAGTHDLTVQFTNPGDAVLTLRAEDAAGNAAEATATVTVAPDTFRVVLPEQGIRFPPLPPGGGPVDADQPFQVINEGSATRTPRIDVSDLQGPGTVPLAGRLQVGTRADATEAWMWTSYDAPLTSLPDLPPGASIDVMLRILHVPDPLPAGDYHTSFTVVP